MAHFSGRRWTPLRLGLWVVVLVCVLAAVRYLAAPPSESPAEAGNRLPLPASPIVLPETAIRTGDSATTPDRSFTVHVNRIAGKTVDLTVSSATQDVYRFKKAEVGRRLVVPAPHGTYYVDLVRVSGKTAYLTISKR